MDSKCARVFQRCDYPRNDLLPLESAATNTIFFTIHVKLTCLDKLSKTVMLCTSRQLENCCRCTDVNTHTHTPIHTYINNTQDR